MSTNIFQLIFREEKRVYFFAQWSLVLFLLLIALLPIPASLLSWIQANASNWQNIQYLQLVFLLAGIGIAIQTYVNQYQRRYDSIALPYHILITILVIYASVATVLYGKYLFGIMPDLETGEALYLYTVLPETIFGLFSKQNISQPPFLMPMLGETIFTLRLMTVISLLVICGVLKVITQRYSNKFWSWITPGIFLALVPLVTWSGPPTKPEYFAPLFSSCAVLVYYLFGFNGKKLWVLGWVAVAFLMSVVLSVVSLGRPGSTPNYFLEGVIIGSLAIGLMIAVASSDSTVKGIVWVINFY